SERRNALSAPRDGMKREVANADPRPVPALPRWPGGPRNQRSRIHNGWTEHLPLRTWWQSQFATAGDHNAARHEPHAIPSHWQAGHHLARSDAARHPRSESSVRQVPASRYLTDEPFPRIQIDLTLRAVQASYRRS